METRPNGQDQQIAELIKQAFGGLSPEEQQQFMEEQMAANPAMMAQMGMQGGMQPGMQDMQGMMPEDLSQLSDEELMEAMGSATSEETPGPDVTKSAEKLASDLEAVYDFCGRVQCNAFVDEFRRLVGGDGQVKEASSSPSSHLLQALSRLLSDTE